jgi:hypothetical protein
MLDKNGELIEDRIYNLKDMDRTLVIEARTQLVANEHAHTSSMVVPVSCMACMHAFGLEPWQNVDGMHAPHRSRRRALSGGACMQV